jgi:molybdate transport system substrate-binding protein
LACAVSEASSRLAAGVGDRENHLVFHENHANPRRLIALTFAVVITACGSVGGGGSEEVVVSAAASLAGAFGEIESAFEELYPELDIVLNVGGSATLREQILGGAPSDVFASANMANMDLVIGGGFVTGQARPFASNSLVIAVPNGNPGQITGLGDFENEDLLIGLCSPEVPCGELATLLFAVSALTPLPDTVEPNVRSLLVKIEAAELDGGLVYVTDVSTSTAVEHVEMDMESPCTTYEIAALKSGRNEAAGALFVEFVLSEAGQGILATYGFGSP